MRIDIIIYDIITCYHFMSEKVYSSSIRTCLRGTSGVVSQKLERYYFFGKHKEVDINKIEQYLRILVKRNLIKAVSNGQRYHYIPTDLDMARKRFEWIIEQNISLKYSIGENTINV